MATVVLKDLQLLWALYNNFGDNLIAIQLLLKDIHNKDIYNYIFLLLVMMLILVWVLLMHAVIIP